jgi:hypothetical protein
MARHLNSTAATWWTVSGILAVLAGGFAAGRLAGQPKESTAGWHGLTSWALTTLLVFWLLTSTIGGVVGGAYNTLSNAVSGVASTARMSSTSASNWSAVMSGTNSAMGWARGTDLVIRSSGSRPVLSRALATQGAARWHTGAAV